MTGFIEPATVGATSNLVQASFINYLSDTDNDLISLSKYDTVKMLFVRYHRQQSRD